MTTGQTNTGGAGSELFGELTVTPGAEITIGVGGRGGNAVSDSRPGDGGWGLDNRSGGRGGMARRGIDGGGGHWDADRFALTGDTTLRGSGFVRIYWDVTPSRPTLSLTNDGQRQVTVPAPADVPVTLTVTPSDVSGTVDIYTSNPTSGTRKLTTLEIRDGTASCTVPAATLARGTNDVFAVYDGSRSYLAATSNMLDVTVRKLTRADSGRLSRAGRIPAAAGPACPVPRC